MPPLDAIASDWHDASSVVLLYSLRKVLFSTCLNEYAMGLGIGFVFGGPGGAVAVATMMYGVGEGRSTIYEMANEGRESKRVENYGILKDHMNQRLLISFGGPYLFLLLALLLCI